MVRRFSLRVSTHFTGLRSVRAANETTGSSGYIPALPPNAPPTSGATTLTLSGFIERISASSSRAPCGSWVER